MYVGRYERRRHRIRARLTIDPTSTDASGADQCCDLLYDMMIAASDLRCRDHRGTRSMIVVSVMLDDPFVALVGALGVEIDLIPFAGHIDPVLGRQHCARLPSFAVAPILNPSFMGEINLMIAVVDVQVLLG